MEEKSTEQSLRPATSNISQNMNDCKPLEIKQQNNNLGKEESQVDNHKNQEVMPVNPKNNTLVSNNNFKNEDEMMNSAVSEAGRQATTLKDVIDVGVTGKALQKDGVIEELTAKKEQELKEDALAKVIKSEAERIKRETDKLTEEGKKQLAELENQINKAKAEKERLDKEADKCLAFFNNHKSILKYSGCKEPMSMKYMQCMGVIGFIIMCIVKILFSPLILAGLFIELLIDIIGGVTGSVKQNAMKIIVGILVFVFVGAVVVGAYYGITIIFK